ncbi:MAG: hypothetical protein ACI4E2_06300 [Acetatifactor sp.]
MRQHIWEKAILFLSGFIKESGRSIRKRGVVAVALLLLLSLGCIPPVLAWFQNQKSLQTVTLIRDPNALVIGAGNAQAIKELELGNIDVSEEPRYRDVVFCVYSQSSNPYQLQLAHTTNIGFQYTIFPAQKGEGGGSSGIDYLNNRYTFDSGTPLAGGYLNRREETGLAFETGTYHEKTYATDDALGAAYINVQSNAEPLYWRSADSIAFPAERNEEGYYINYYVLRVSWGESLVNNKETDMVYLMVETSGTDGQ